MGALSNAAKFGTDTATAGVRDQALAALVNAARAVLAAEAQNAGSKPAQELAFARAVIQQPTAYRDTAGWVAATDTDVAAATTPTEAQINTALTRAWSVLARLY